ncbi:formylglycine-generating enzyme family protein, partial [Candidatus Pacebacteria bacterium]|nr:formylglycine-generating enzyme family protein [Candidatus Paceibacterota bacterium]
KTGERAGCISAAGVFDAVGNVWEWTNDDVFDGSYNGRALPVEGYVRQVDRGGIATVSGTSSAELFGEDYIWSKETGVYAIMRGGFYASKDDAGVYAVHAATLPTMRGAAIGFRCVQ